MPQRLKCSIVCSALRSAPCQQTASQLCADHEQFFAAVRTQDFAKHHGRRAGAAENRYYNYEAKEDHGSIASHAVDTEEAIAMVWLDLMLSRCMNFFGFAVFFTTPKMWPTMVRQLFF